MFEDGLGLVFCDDGGESGGVGLFDGLKAAEMFEEAAGGGFADSGNVAEFGGAIADLAPLAMEGDGEAVSLVADHLDQVQNG